MSARTQSWQQQSAQDEKDEEDDRERETPPKLNTLKLNFDGGAVKSSRVKSAGGVDRERVKEVEEMWEQCEQGAEDEGREKILCVLIGLAGRAGSQAGAVIDAHFEGYCFFPVTVDALLFLGGWFN